MHADRSSSVSPEADTSGSPIPGPRPSQRHAKTSFGRWPRPDTDWITSAMYPPSPIVQTTFLAMLALLFDVRPPHAPHRAVVRNGDRYVALRGWSCCAWARWGEVPAQCNQFERAERPDRRQHRAGEKAAAVVKPNGVSSSSSSASSITSASSAGMCAARQRIGPAGILNDHINRDLAAEVPRVFAGEQKERRSCLPGRRPQGRNRESRPFDNAERIPNRRRRHGTTSPRLPRPTRRPSPSRNLQS